MKKSDRKLMDLDLTAVVSNSENTRDAVPGLTRQGWGVFEPGTNQKKALAEMALSKDHLEQGTFLALVEDHEPDIVGLAGQLATQGQLQNVRVREIEKGRYDLIFGCRRALAVMYNHAKSAGELPARLFAEIVDGDQAQDVSAIFAGLAENTRKEPSPMDKARTFQKLKRNFAMKPAEIGRQWGVSDKTVRRFLRLLDLPKDMQEKVHMGKLSLEKAIAYLDGKNKPPANQDGKVKPGVPSLKQIRALYECQEQADLPPEYQPLVTEEVRRLFAFWLGVAYQPRKQPPLCQDEQDRLHEKAQVQEGAV